MTRAHSYHCSQRASTDGPPLDAIKGKLDALDNVLSERWRVSGLQSGYTASWHSLDRAPPLVDGRSSATNMIRYSSRSRDGGTPYSRTNVPAGRRRSKRADTSPHGTRLALNTLSRWTRGVSDRWGCQAQAPKHVRPLGVIERRPVGDLVTRSPTSETQTGHIIQLAHLPTRRGHHVLRVESIQAKRLGCAALPPHAGLSNREPARQREHLLNELRRDIGNAVSGCKKRTSQTRDPRIQRR